MTDAYRRKHFFRLLMLTKERVGADSMWDEFTRLYHPTDADIVNLKLMYVMKKGNA